MDTKKIYGYMNIFNLVLEDDLFAIEPIFNRLIIPGVLKKNEREIKKREQKLSPTKLFHFTTIPVQVNANDLVVLQT